MIGDKDPHAWYYMHHASKLMEKERGLDTMHLYVTSRHSLSAAIILRAVRVPAAVLGTELAARTGQEHTQHTRAVPTLGA